MKRKSKYLKVLTSIFMALFMVFGSIFSAVGSDVYRVKAAESDRLYSTDYYTLSYQNNEIKLLLNSDIRVYQNFTKEDLKELKNSILSVTYRAIYDDLDFEDSSSKKLNSRNRNKLSSTMAGADIDVSTIGSIIQNQLVDFESIDNALDGEGTYDRLIEFYVDRYVNVYMANNEDAIVEDILTDIAEQLTDSIQTTVDNVYELNGAAGYSPDVSIKIDELIANVKEHKDNGESIMISLDDVVDIVKVVDNKESIVNVINEIEVSSEIKDIVKNSSSTESVNFFVSVDMDTIIDIFQNIEMNNNDVKDIVNSIGMDSIIDIVNSIGMDRVVDLANAVHFTKDDLHDVVQNIIPGTSINSLLKTINSVTVDGNLLYDDNEFKMSGLERVIKNLPRPSQIANYTDEQMKITWALDIDTIFGSVNFDLTIGFQGDCSLIRSTAKEISEIFDVYVENGTYYIDIHAPEKLDNLLLRICNSSSISDDIKLGIFNTAFSTIDEIYTKITNKTLDEYIELLKEVDYKTVLANFYNAENLNKLFNTTKFTDARLDKFVDEVCELVSKASNLSYDRIKNFVSRYVDISSLDDTAVEKLVNDTIAVLKKIDSLSLDSSLLREFIDPNSSYTNENIYEYLDKLSNYESYFNRLMQYIAKVYEAAPDRIKDNTILDYYQGNGQFAYSGTINLNIEKLLVTLSSSYGEKIYEALSMVFDRLPSQIKVSITAEIPDVYQVTYNIGNETKVGMLPVGANLDFFANTQSINNYPIQKWVDVNGMEYTTMPATDIELFAVTEFEAYINDGIVKVYDGEPYTLEVTTMPDDNYTYQWYKNDTAIVGATSSTYDVVNVADSGKYYCEVYSEASYNLTKTVEVIISKAQIDATKLQWDYTNAFTYDGIEKTVTLLNLPDVVHVVYDGNYATDAGTYNATAVLEVLDENYEIVGNVADLKWTINPKEVNVVWENEEQYVYNGNVKPIPTATYEDVNGNLVYLAVVESNGKEFKDAGMYLFEATNSNSNYVLANSSLSVNIEKAKVDVSGLTWDYDGAFTYDGTEKVVELSGTVANATAVYTNNAKTNAGTYTASVTFNPVNENYEIVGNIADLEWTIEKAVVDVSGLTWDYDGAFTYDGTEKVVELSGTVANATAVYTNNAKTNAGTYTASVTFNPVNENYEIVGSVADLEWTIEKAVVDVSGLTWDYDGAFTYDETEKVVELSETVSGVRAVYTNNTQTDAGTYTASVTFELTNDNYVLVGSVADLVWTIEKGQIKLYEFRWDYTSTFVYDGSEKTVELSETVSGVRAVYTNNTQTDAGTYTASVTFELTNDNYVLVGSVADLVWTIEKAEVDVSKLNWNYTNAFTYDGTEKTVTLSNAPEFLDIVYFNNVQTEVGSYQAVATIKSNSNNYSVTGVVAPLNWEIKASTSPVDKVNEMTYEDENGVVIVKVTAENGVDSTNSLTVKDETNSTKDVDLSSLVKENEKANILLTYDISFTNANNEVVNYNDNFTVNVLIPENLRDNNNLKVVHIAEDGTVTNMSATRDGNYLTFATTHFSQYAIVEVTPVNASPAWWVWVLIALAVIIIVLLLVLLLRGKNSKGKENVSTNALVETTDYNENDYLVMNSNGKVEQVKLYEAQDDDVLLATLTKDYVIGKVENENLSMFKEHHLILNTVGKVHDENGTISIDMFKEPIKIVAEPNDVNVEKFVVNRSNDNIIVELNQQEVSIKVTNKEEPYQIEENDNLIIIHVSKNLNN